MGNSNSAPAAQLSFGFPLDTKADVPVLPPFAALGLAGWCLILMKMDRLRWLPASLSGLQFRVTAFVASIAMAIATIKTCSDALNSAGSGFAFTPVGGLMKEGVYAYVRNPAYLGLVLVQMPMFAVLYDSAWPLLCNVVLFFYLQDIVIPAEEALLEKSFGAEWEAYKASVNRWLLF